MPSANVELVRAIHAAWQRGDYSSADWAHPEIEYVRPDGPMPGSWSGLAGMAQGARADLDAWEGFRHWEEGYEELDDECVLAFVRFTGRGKTSGLELSEIGAKGAELFHVRDGKVVRLMVYWDRQHALADLGLAQKDTAR